MCLNLQQFKSQDHKKAQSDKIILQLTNERLYLFIQIIF